MPKKSHHSPDPAEARAAAARMLSQARWADTTPEERTAFASWVGSQGGRPRSKAKRCPCGNMTLKLAQTRADRNGKGLGHEPHCKFYRADRHLNRSPKETAQ